MEQSMPVPALQYFWLALTIAALLWYACITVFVAVKGALDIKRMLARLKEFSNGNGGA
ncbi:MAG TPA: hypothetical protein PLO62_01360 [Candidatus Hydrogenedentes bacterium]|nr:hypothetical protein [Candidatus Hydrogenedentota bacterium]HOS02976.1 hypothetical protein [Candidatus Hydrogenedentota bacterium]